jgi:hypothetical protein
LPPEQIAEFFNLQDENIRRRKETFFTKFGWPIAANGGTQVLAASANSEMAECEYQSLAKYRRVARFFGKLGKCGIQIIFPDFEHKSNPTGNDNAVKDGLIMAGQEPIDKGGHH